MTNIKVTFFDRTNSWRTIAALMLATLLLAGIAATNTAQAQTYTVLYNFGGLPGDPTTPSLSGLITQGRDGNLYTTSFLGGSHNAGTAFKITTGGTLTVLHNFGDWPRSGLVLGTDGYYYGTATYGQGSVFKLGGKQLTTLYSFTGGSDGDYPFAPPIQGLDGNLYGTTWVGGSSDLGTVYKLTPSGELTTLYEFDGTQGGYPTAPLMQATDGNFYGTSSSSAGCCVLSGDGTVFKITPAGVLTTLHFFEGTDGAIPRAPLVQGSDGNFYGTANEGGEFSGGVVFKLTSAGVYSVLHNFSGVTTDGAYPDAGLVQASDGNFYGTTVEGGTEFDGTIFSISPQGNFSVLYSFDGTTGSAPQITLLQHTNGVLYGEGSGGTYGGGVFFSLDVGAPPFVRFLPAAGMVGKTVEILGQGFTGTTSVAFNGVPASYSVKSDTFLTATVPAGATWGFITVTTPTGTLTSNKKFIVKP